jgi:biotin carboxyl carrier protein
MKTYRYRGHSMSDPAKYRSREEVQEMREKSDPIEGVKKHLEAAGVTEDEIKEIDKNIRKIVNDSADFAETAQSRIWASSILTFWWRHTDGNRIKMPALSPTMEEGTLAKWLVKEGDDGEIRRHLAEIETDKATMEFEAVDEGTVGKILVPEGTGREGRHADRDVRARAVKAPLRPRRCPSRGAGSPVPRRPLRLRSPRQRPCSLRGDRRAGPGSCRHRSRPRSRCARRCARRWPRRCAPTSVFVMGEEVASIRAPTR